MTERWLSAGNHHALGNPEMQQPAALFGTQTPCRFYTRFYQLALVCCARSRGPDVEVNKKVMPK